MSFLQSSAELMSKSDQAKVVLITGGTAGLGKAAAILLAERRYRVIAASRSAAKRAELDAFAKSNKLPLTTVELDVCSDASVNQALHSTLEKFGAIDILVNNAGVGQATVRGDNRQRPIKFWEVTSEQWELFVTVHNNAPMALSRALVHDMMRQKWAASSTSRQASAR